MAEPTPRHNRHLPTRVCAFDTLVEALDYAAEGETGFNFYSARGDLVERLPYRTLRDEARAVARRLMGLGLQAGDRIGILADTHGDFMRAFFGALCAGVVPTPLPLPAAFGGRDAYVAQIRRQLEVCGARSAVGPAKLATYLQPAAAGLGLGFVGSHQDLAAAPASDRPLPAPAGDDLCYLQFSSGSTRFPKGVAVTNRAALNNLRSIALYGLCIGPDDRCTSWLPFYHDMGLVGFVLAPLCCQISCDYLATRDFARRPLMWLKLIARNRGTLSFSPTFGYELCARRAESASTEGIDVSSWRGAGIGGDMIRPAVMQRFADAFAPVGFRATAFVPSYGMAEATLALSFAPLNRGIETDAVDLDALAGGHATPAGPDSRARAFALCGRPMPGHELAVRDHNGAVLPERRVGKIYTRGASIMREYFGQPEETAEVLAPDGWLDTGDLGYWLNGQIVITGRAKDLMIVNGRNIWPQDVEWSAEQAPGLRSGDVAAFSVEDAEGERVVALVQCRPSDAAQRTQLRQAVAGIVREQVGVEAEVVLVPPHALPQTSSGKLSRSRAKALYLEGAFGAPGPAAQPAAAAS